MPRVISQNAFDQVVRENVDDLGMNPEEAVHDAVEQFRTQGVDLSNIITEHNMRQVAEQELSLCHQHLVQSLNDMKVADVENDLEIIRKWCIKGVPYRVLAGSLKLYEPLILALDQKFGDVILASSIFKSLTCLMKGYPDLLDNHGIEIMLKWMCFLIDQTRTSTDACVAVLQWAQECCKKHEKNRQGLMAHNINGIISKMLCQTSESPLVLIEVCELIKLLTMDDDIREEVSKAHEHARVLAVDNLCYLCGQLERALSALIVRNEFCEKVDSAGGIGHLFDVLATHPDVEKVNLQCLRLLKALAGNDDVKAHLMEAGAAPMILSTMVRFKASPLVMHAGCGSLAALSLRSPENSEILVENGAADVLVDALKLHRDAPNVQKFACLAIRNIVARNKKLCSAFLSLGAEEMLNSVDKTFCWDDAKAALRDLGCKVELKEPFTGKGIKLAH